MKNLQTRSNLFPFFIIAFVISWGLWTAPVLNSNGVTMPNILLLFGQFALFGPLIAGFIFERREKGKGAVKGLLKRAWDWKFKKIWLLPTLLLPAGMILLTLIVKLNVENNAFALGEVFAPIPLFAIILFFIGGPLEEFGWRGYALPRLLKRYSFVVASLILGLMHGLWHIPLHFMEGTVQSAMPLWEFIAVTTVGAVIYSWIYIHTKGNLMLMLLYHWAGNFSAALLVYWDTVLGRYVFFGIQLLVVIIIVVINSKTKDDINTS